MSHRSALSLDLRRFEPGWGVARIGSWYNATRPMIFFVFAPLAFIVIRLSVNWRWKTVFLAAVALGLAADAMLDYFIANRL